MTENNLSSALAFEDRFPASEKRLETSFTQDQIYDLNQSAAEVLNAIITLEQMSYDHADPDLKGKSAELHRLEQKIDFVTELLARVLFDQQNRPDNKTIKLSSQQVLWQPDIALNSGDYCLLSIYLSPKYPAALELPVEVINSNIDGASPPCVEARILYSNNNVIDDLTRMVFLYHRRQIARNRTQS